MVEFFFFSATSFRVITANPGMLSATLFMQLKLISSTHSRSKHLCWVLHIPSFCWDVLQDQPSADQINDYGGKANHVGKHAVNLK